MFKTRRTVYWAVLLMIFPSAAAAADHDPMAAIKASTDTVIAILNDTRYKAAGTRSVQREALWKNVKPMFDFGEVSRRAVAFHWRNFTDAEKTAFTDVFSRFLGNTYIDKIQGEYHNEQIVYLGQAFHSDTYAEVKTHIVRESLKIPVGYRMRKGGGGQWKVYDVIVEGVSLVKNYRTQFASILKKKTPAHLIEQLDRKLAEQNRRFAENG